MRILKGLFMVLMIAGVTITSGCGNDSSGGGWIRTIGGAGVDWGMTVQQTSDGGYIVAGSTNSSGAGFVDFYLIKTDSSGNVIWTKTFGGIYDDNGYSVQQTRDGGYIIAGSTYSFGAEGLDVYIIKTDSAGNVIWERTFGGADDSIGSCVQETSDGGYIIAGTTGDIVSSRSLTNAFLLKIDSSGNTIWTKTFGGPEAWGNSVRQTTDGGYIITGTRYSLDSNYYHIYLVKTDPDGNITMEKTLGDFSDSSGSSVWQTTDGGFVITGDTFLPGVFNSDVYILKTDFNGNVIWAKTFGGIYDDTGYSVQQTQDGGYIIAGTLSMGQLNSEVYLIRLDANGNAIWAKTFGEANAAHGYSVQQTRDGGYIIAGEIYSPDASLLDVYLIKTDGNGNI